MTEDIGGLKFIASMFKMAIKEIDNIMGTESLQTIFRLMGENVGHNITKRLKASSPTEFSEKLINNILEPVLGKDGAEFTVEGDTIAITLKVWDWNLLYNNLLSYIFN